MPRLKTDHRKYFDTSTSPKEARYILELFHTGSERRDEIVDRYQIPLTVRTVDHNNRTLKPLMLDHAALKVADKVLNYLINPTLEREAGIAGAIDLATVKQWTGNLPPWFWCWTKNPKGAIVCFRNPQGRNVVCHALFVSKNGVLKQAKGEVLVQPRAKAIGFVEEEEAANALLTDALPSCEFAEAMR